MFEITYSYWIAALIIAIMCLLPSARYVWRLLIGAVICVLIYMAMYLSTGKDRYIHYIPQEQEILSFRLQEDAGYIYIWCLQEDGTPIFYSTLFTTSLADELVRGRQKKRATGTKLMLRFDNEDAGFNVENVTPPEAERPKYGD